MASQLLGIKTRFTNDLGSPLVGGQVYTYFAGTSTNQDTYSDAALTVPNTNPVVLDDTGSADIFLKGSYRIRVFDKSGRFIEEQDNVTQAASQGDATEINERIDSIQSDVGLQKLDTGITATAQYSGSIERNQADVNSDVVSIKSFSTLAAAQAYATDNNVKIFIPTGEHTYDLTNADMTLFWGYGQLKDVTIGDIYKPKNGDFVTPEMFGIREKVDETTKLSKMLHYAASNGLTVIWTGGSEYWYTELDIRGAYYDINWEISNGKSITLKSLKTPDDLTEWGGESSIKLGGREEAYRPVLVNDVKEGFDTLVTSDTTGINKGDLIIVRGQRLINAWDRGMSREGQIKLVDRLRSDNRILLKDSMGIHITANDTSDHIVSEVISSDSLRLDSLDLEEKYARVLFRVLTGSKTGTTAYCTAWDNTTKVATFSNSLSGISVGDAIQKNNYASLVILRPAKVNIHGNFIITREPQYNAKDEDYGYRGIYIMRAKDVSITGIYVENFSESGITIHECYNTRLVDCHADGANRSFYVYGGTGYGFHISQSALTVLENCTATRCRKGYDIAGTQFQSWDTSLVNCTAIGGGLTYTGESFLPMGTANNSGFGTHGGSVNANYIGCNSRNVKAAYSLHGINEYISNCTHSGYAEMMIRHAGALNVIVDNFIYNDMHSTVDPSSPDYSINNTRFAECFIQYDCLLGDVGYPVVIKNTICKSFTDSFIYAYNSGELPEFVLGGNTIYVGGTSNKDGEQAFHLITTSGITRKFSTIRDIGGNSIVDKNKSRTKIYDYFTLDLDNDNALIAKKAVKTTYNLLMPDNSVRVIDLVGRMRGVVISIYPLNAGRLFACEGVLLYFNQALDYSPLAAVNKKLVELSSDVLTGTTGNTGVITLSFNPEDLLRPSLYVENRLGKPEEIVIDVQPIAR